MSIITDYPEQRIHLDRQCFNDLALKEKHSFNDENNLNELDLVQNTKKYLNKHYKPNRTCMKNFLFDRFPILKWIIKYDLKHDILKDLIAGLTIGIIQIAPSKLFNLTHLLKTN